MIKLALLPTDWLLLGVGFLVFAMSLMSAQKAWIRDTWRLFFSYKINQIALSVFLFYGLIAFLDSLRFESGTVLDYLFWALHTQSEISFSEPFACIDFSNHEPLQYACRTLKGDKAWDIFSRTMGSLTKMMLLCFVAWQGYFKKNPHLKTIFWTLCVFGLILCISFDLSSEYHIWGTNKIGQDLFFANLKSIRTAFVIGIVTLVFMIPFAVLLGALSGYFGGMIDDLIQYLYTALSSIPAVLLISATMLSLQVFLSKHSDWFDSAQEQSDARLLLLCMVLGLSGWVGLCRILRAEALKLKNADFIAASHTLGLSHRGIIVSHLIPNMMHLIVMAATLEFSGLVLSEVVLSYVGVGVDPGIYSWGNLINGARSELARSPVVWWSLSATFLCMCGLVLSANLISEGFQQAFDPKGRE